MLKGAILCRPLRIVSAQKHAGRVPEVRGKVSWKKIGRFRRERLKLPTERRKTNPEGKSWPTKSS